MIRAPSSVIIRACTRLLRRQYTSKVARTTPLASMAVVCTSSAMTTSVLPTRGLLQVPSTVDDFQRQHNQSIRYTMLRVRLFSSSQDDETDADIATFFDDHNISQPSVRLGILKALQAAYGRELTVDDLKAFGAAGIQALAESVAHEEEQKALRDGAPRPSIDVHFAIPHHKTGFDLPWKLGDSILDVAKNDPQGVELLGEYMEGNCGGQMSCCTCHVYVDQNTFEMMGEPSEEENDMLDLAYEPKSTSRLGCQIVLTEKLLKSISNASDDHSVKITIPEDVNNVWN